MSGDKTCHRGESESHFLVLMCLKKLTLSHKCGKKGKMDCLLSLYLHVSSSLQLYMLYQLSMNSVVGRNLVFFTVFCNLYCLKMLMQHFGCDLN